MQTHQRLQYILTKHLSQTLKNRSQGVIRTSHPPPPLPPNPIRRRGPSRQCFQITILQTTVINHSNRHLTSHHGTLQIARRLTSIPVGIKFPRCFLHTHQWGHGGHSTVVTGRCRPIRGRGVHRPIFGTGRKRMSRRYFHRRRGRRRHGGII